jgi:hypothetical protein
MYWVMHMQAEIEWNQRCDSRSWSRDWRCTWRGRSCDFGHPLGVHEQVNSAMHLEAVNKSVGRYTWRPWSIVIAGVRASDLSAGSRLQGRCNVSTVSTYWLICTCRKVGSWVQHLPRDEKITRSGRQLILEWCTTRSMLYLVLTHDDGTAK